MNSHTLRFLSSLVATSVLFSACGGTDHSAREETSLPTVTAATVTADARQIPVYVDVRGVVEAEKSAAISSRVTAMVTSVHIKAGDRVRRGQVLIEIDPATARGQASQATGALAQARAALSLAERNYQRFQALAQKDAASDLELDMARMQYEQAQGAVEQAEGAVSAARSVAAESSVRAPFDGLVVQRMVEVGDLAAPGRPLLTLESESGRRLSLAVPASLISRKGLAPGDALAIRLDGRRDLGAFEGTIVERSPAADPMSHSFQLKVELPKPGDGEDPIASGSTGRGRIPSEERTAVVVPQNAIHRQGGLAFVVALDDSGRTESKIVTVGDAVDETDIEILSGLGGGETILVGLRALPPNGSPYEEAS